jgi:hypothetical protein
LDSVAARLSFFLVLSAVVWLGFANTQLYISIRLNIPDLKKTKLLAGYDQTELIWPVEDNPNPSDDPGGINIPLPDNVNIKVEYNPETPENTKSFKPSVTSIIVLELQCLWMNT